MTAVLQSQALSKRYGHRPALANCTLSIPAGWSAQTEQGRRHC
jgi:hypothetical protein